MHAALLRSTSRHAPAPTATPVPHESAAMTAAPIAPPIETGSSRPNSMPPARIAAGGANSTFAPRRVGNSSSQSCSQRSQRRPGGRACAAQRVSVQRPQLITGVDVQARHSSRRRTAMWKACPICERRQVAARTRRRC
jgi:hypothetical protein